MKFDHIAVNVKDISRSVAWYKEHLGAEVLYEDSTWAMLLAGGVKLALTLTSQHPAHIAFTVDPEQAGNFFEKAARHRDGSISRYLADPDGNAIEWIHYPENP